MVEPVIRGLARLRAREAGPLSQGLSPENAQACLHQAIRPLNEHSITAALKEAAPMPSSIVFVIAYGVFSSPIEWVALALAGGSTVHIKAPSNDPALVRALVEDMQKEGLPITWSTDRSLPEADAVVAFGDDKSVQSIAKASPLSRHALYGHRFSVALVTGTPEEAANPLALDVCRYDTRGCMAPTAVFTTGDPTALAASIANAMQNAEHQWPRGAVDPALGPEWRRRMGLAQILGVVHKGANWAVTTLPPKYFTPSALPRMVTIHPVEDATEFQSLMSHWRPWLSTCGTDAPTLVGKGFHRVCALGWMQAPPFPRNHDGRAMLSGLQTEPGEN
jgi:hypothetical protein